MVPEEVLCAPKVSGPPTVLERFSFTKDAALCSFRVITFVVSSQEVLGSRLNRDPGSAQW